MSQLILIFVCIGIGILLRALRKLPENAPAALNGFIIHVSLPAVTLLLMHELTLDQGFLLPASMPWLLFGFAAAYVLILGKLLGWSRSLIGALILTAGLGNTSFVGFPLLEALYGKQALGVGILTDQPGSFLVVSFLGIYVASRFSSRRSGSRWSSILKFPPFLALILALVLKPIAFAPGLKEILERLGSTLVPLALVSVGLQMNLKAHLLQRYRQPLALGLFFKLLLAPLLLGAMYRWGFGAQGEALQITLAEAAMAPMITAAVLATEYELEPELANLMVAVGIPISLVSVPLWAHLMRGL